MKRLPWLVAGLLMIAALSAGVLPRDPPLRVSVRPSPAYIERAGGAQLINCDFIVENGSDDAWTLEALEVSVMDAAGRLQLRRFVNDNGNSPSIDTLNKRDVPARGRILIFNPLFGFDDQVRLSSLLYRFSWRSRGEKQEALTEVTVRPVVYEGRVPLRLPLRGSTLVWDGHDYYAHHRRFDYLNPHAQEDGARSNPDRYGHDFVPVDAAGEMRRGDAADNGAWFGFGRPIYAAGAGRVVAAVDDQPDNREVDTARFAANTLADYGNYIVIDHGGGEFALYGHLKHGSAVVKIGDVVRRGQPVAAVGASGSSLMPHLHFQLQTTADTNGEGLPSSFDAFRRRLGGRSVPVSRGPVDSGDFVEDAGGDRDAAPPKTRTGS